MIRLFQYTTASSSVKLFHVFLALPPPLKKHIKEVGGADGGVPDQLSSDKATTVPKDPSGKAVATQGHRVPRRTV
jgi:hypothetical protein